MLPMMTMATVEALMAVLMLALPPMPVLTAVPPPMAVLPLMADLPMAVTLGVRLRTGAVSMMTTGKSAGKSEGLRPHSLISCSATSW